MKARVNNRFEYAFSADPDWAVKALSPDRYEVVHEGRIVSIQVLEWNARSRSCLLGIDGYVLRVDLEDELIGVVRNLRQQSEAASGDMVLTAPIPGLIKSINHRDGEGVQSGEALLVLEAMKMENSIQAPIAADEVKYHVKPGDRVVKGQELCTLIQSEEK